MRVIVLNGGSSSSKTSTARQLQAMLLEPWLAVSIDGTVEVGSVFARLERPWAAGIAATARAGAPVVVDDVFLGGAASQARWRAALPDLPVAWVGVHCEPGIATQRESRRPDRAAGMAALQARQVHHEVVYDVQVDTSRTSPEECARSIVTRLQLPSSTATTLGRQVAP